VNGARKPAPCGHPGEVVIGSYVRCLSGCDGAVPEAVNREKTEPVGRAHDWNGTWPARCRVCHVSNGDPYATKPCPGDPRYQVSKDPAKCKHPARFSYNGVTRCASCDERISPFATFWNPSVRLRKPSNTPPALDRLSQCEIDFMRSMLDEMDEVWFDPTPYRFLDGV
jgi:hypothetical protein